MLCRTVSAIRSTALNPPPPQGVALIFIPVGGGDPSPLDHLPPSTLIHPRIRVLVFSFGPILPSRAFGAPIAGFFGHSTVSFLPSVAETMSQRPISAFFGTPVQPCPRVKRDDIVNRNLYFRFQDRWTGMKRQEAYNVAQKACSTLFLNTPMATLREFITQAAVMASQVLVPPPVQRRMTLVSPTLIDLRQTI